MRNAEQRRYRMEHKGAKSNSESEIIVDDVEEYEAVCCNNEVHDCKSGLSTNVDTFEDYITRDPDCSAVIPAMLYQAGELMESFISREGDWEHKALKSIKDRRNVNPALDEPSLPTTGDINRDFYNGWLQR